MSVGHVARQFEAEGLPTVIVAVDAFETRMRMMTLPRVLLTPFMMGRPVGRPHRAAEQIRVLRAALNLLEDASQAGTVKTFV